MVDDTLQTFSLAEPIHHHHTYIYNHIKYIHPKIIAGYSSNIKRKNFQSAKVVKRNIAIVLV